MKTNKSNLYECSNILLDDNYFGTKEVRNSLRNKFKNIQNFLDKKDREILLKYFKKLSTLLDSIVQIKTRLTWNNTLNYTISHTVNFSDF
ncbi:MAG: hypothetical protein U9N34_07845 [Candidatus Cloacimonadota bacterium]|nr:hypothetical protein [Candidatus Cloacimonadota bacterium]